MSCSRVRARLSPWLEGDLAAADRDRMQAHLDACPGCRRELRALQGGIELLRALDEPAAPPHLEQRIVARLRDAEAHAASGRLPAVLARLAAQLAVAGLVAVGAIALSQRMISGDRPAPRVAMDDAGARMEIAQPFGASAPPAEPTPADLDAVLDRALVDAGFLVRAWRERGESTRETWTASLVERARARGDAPVLAAALRSRPELDAAALADRLAVSP